MSARHSKPAEAPRLRARTVLGGAAMTAVFLGGGAGVALADESPVPTEQGQDALGSIDLSKNADFQNLRGDVDDILGKVPFFESDPLGTHQKSDSKGHWGSDHKWHHGSSDCGCQHKSSDEHKKQDEKKNPCPPKSEDKKNESTPSSSESEGSSPKVQTIADTSDSKVESASTSPSSDESQVDSASTGDTTPVGAADTGDGSSSPGFTPTFTPAASSSPLDNPYALGGGAAAAALLGAYGVSVARRRTGAHRG